VDGKLKCGRFWKAINMQQLYYYVGPKEIYKNAASKRAGHRVESAQDLAQWLRQSGQTQNHAGLIPVTFVVDKDGYLRVADRRSEHIACAGGGPVLAAGEMFLRATAGGIELEEASNQSTGYCPRAECWIAVAEVLDRLGISHPDRFTCEIVFRRCRACGGRNIVKDDSFICYTCGAELPANWNFGEE
jgi:hypothetical protein